MATGLWTEPAVPHKGWTCVDFDDLRERCFKCEMCQVKIIRYVHVMTHPEYDGQLKCGRVCASNMAEGYDAKRRETNYKNKLSRVETLEKKRWGKSKKSNPRLLVKGYCCTVFYHHDGWYWSLSHKSFPVRFSPPYKYQNEAKAAALWELDNELHGNDVPGLVMAPSLPVLSFTGLRRA